MRNKKNSNNHYYYITPEDKDVETRISFTIPELKVIYNHFADVLDEHPEMSTYRDICDKISKRLDDDCKCDGFYGVNEVLDMQWFYADALEDVEVGCTLNVQSSIKTDDEDIILFFSPDQLDDMFEINKQMKKKYKKHR